MLSDIPKLFDKNFVVGYVLPSLLFLMVMLYGLNIEVDISENGTIRAQKILWNLGSLTAVSWVAAVILAAVNHNLIRIFEGYSWPPFLRRSVGRMKVRRWSSLREQLARVEADWVRRSACGEAVHREVIIARNELKKRLATEYPDQEHLILPTRFGNVIRSFECYARVVYGVDGVPGWVRLLLIMPSDKLDLVRSAKTHVDMFVNASFLSALAATAFLAKAVAEKNPVDVVYVVLSVAAVVAGYRLAVVAAGQWGAIVMAVFDTYLHELATHLGYDLPTEPNRRRLFWERYSQTIIYHEPFLEEEFSEYFSLAARARCKPKSEDREKPEASPDKRDGVKPGQSPVTELIGRDRSTS